MKELNKTQLKEINGGIVWYAAIGYAILAAAAYEHGKHFGAGLISPFESNE